MRNSAISTLVIPDLPLVSWKIILLFITLQLSTASHTRVYFERNSANRGSFDDQHYRQRGPSVYALDLDNSLAFSPPPPSVPSCGNLRVLWRQADKMLRNSPFVDSITNRLINRNPLFVYNIMVRMLETYQYYYDSPSASASSPSWGSSSRKDSSSLKQASKYLPSDVVVDQVNSDERNADDKTVYGHVISSPDQSRKSSKPAPQHSAAPPSVSSSDKAGFFGQIIDNFETEDDNRISDSSKKEDSEFFSPPAGLWAKGPADVSST